MWTGGHIIEAYCAREKLLHVFADLITADADCGSDPCANICRQATELCTHSFNGSCNDAACCTAPSSVSNADHLFYRIVEDDRHTIGEREGQSNSALTGN